MAIRKLLTPDGAEIVWIQHDDILGARLLNRSCGRHWSDWMRFVGFLNTDKVQL